MQQAVLGERANQGAERRAAGVERQVEPRGVVGLGGLGQGAHDRRRDRHRLAEQRPDLGRQLLVVHRGIDRDQRGPVIAHDRERLLGRRAVVNRRGRGASGQQQGERHQEQRARCPGWRQRDRVGRAARQPLVRPQVDRGPRQRAPDRGRDDR